MPLNNEESFNQKTPWTGLTIEEFKTWLGLYGDFTATFTSGLLGPSTLTKTPGIVGIGN